MAGATTGTMAVTMAVTLDRATIGSRLNKNLIALLSDFKSVF